MLARALLERKELWQPFYSLPLMSHLSLRDGGPEHLRAHSLKLFNEPHKLAHGRQFHPHFKILILLLFRCGKANRSEGCH